VLNDHADYRWVSARALVEYDFAPADIPFVEKLQNQELKV
jgi:8-oxo-dGTP diphosphatase